jgi:hypothetical protein
MGRTLIAVGVLLVATGVLVQIGVPLGRLPGDIIIRRGGGTFYFPIVTCIVVSVVLTLVMTLLRK